MNSLNPVYDKITSRGYSVLLAGVVGSYAYGLNKKGSDVDRLGVYAVPTRSLFILEHPKDSIQIHSPSDAAFHEVIKYARLAVQCNPTILELLWLDELTYSSENKVNVPLLEVVHPLGRELIGIRNSFVSAKRVRAAYLGYATQQFKKLSSRNGKSFSSTTRNRTSKHARHLARLLHQGYTFYTTGVLPIRLNDPEWYEWFSNQSASEWSDWFAKEREKFLVASSVLPSEPNVDNINDWLVKVREHFC